jgi:hypothetical protein
MRRLLTKSALLRNRTGKGRGEEAFGILESLVVLALILTVVVSLNWYFVKGRDQLVYQKARLEFEEDILRLMMITEENAVCEHLSFINNVKLALAPHTVLAKLDRIELYGTPVLEVKKKKRYEVKSIELVQESIFYAIAPTRVRGRIIVRSEFYDRYGKPVASVPAEKKMAFVDIILASDTGGPVTSCYGSFSRRIACRDGNGLYNAEAKPNCVF